MEYVIKITGSGTREDIANALRVVADAIYHETSQGHGKNLSDESIDESNWEDNILFTELKKA